MTAYDSQSRSADLIINELSGNHILSWQHERSNIGLLLAPLLRACGWQGDILSLVDALPIGRKQVSANDLLAVMAVLGFTISSEVTGPQKLSSAQVPCLFIPKEAEGWQQGIVITDIGPLGISWEDGRTQHRGQPDDSAGTIYRFARNPGSEVAENSGDSAAQDWLTAFGLRFNPLVWHMIWLSCVVHMFSLAMPIFSMVVYDRVIATHAVGTLPLLVFGVFGAFMVETIIRWLRLRIAAWVGTRSGIMVTNALLERLLFLPAPLIEQASISAQIARIRAFETVRDFVTGPLFLSVLEAPFMLVLILAIALLAGPVVLVVLATLACYALLVLALRSRWKIQGRDSAYAMTQQQELLGEITRNIRQIRIAGLANVVQQRYMQISERAVNAQASFNHTSTLLQFAAGLLTVASIVATTGWNLERIWAGSMSGGALVACMILNWRLMNMMQSCCSALPQIEQIRSAIQQVRQVMLLKPEAHAEHHVMPMATITQTRIQMANIGLRYARKVDPVFIGLSADIRPGQIVAIHGANGSGKTSVLKMLLGLYPPAVGTLRFNGHDYRQIDPRNLRREIAYFSQSQELMPGTIADNLRIIDPLVPDHKLRQALMWSDAWDSISAMPSGMNTVVSPHMPILSDGLIARIRLARLYLSDRPLLLIDEMPPQLLNSITCDRFRTHLEKCRGNRTVIFVAQREDWLEFADQVIWLRPDGRPLTGSPEHVLKAIHSFQGAEP